MTNKQLLVAISILGALASKAALADNNYDKRFYVAPAFSYVWTDSDRETSRNEYGASVAIGKAVSKHFNVELKAFYNSFEHENKQSGKTEHQWDNFGSTVDLQYYFNRNDLSPYAVVGAGIMDSRVHGKNGVGLVTEAGLGLAYKINDSVSLRSDVRYRYNNNFNNNLTGNNADEYNDMVVNVGLVIPFGSACDKKVCNKKPRSAAINPDLDGDGILNENDKCPKTKPGVKVGKSGCALVVTLKGINFDISSANLTENSKTILNKLAAEIKAYPNKGDVEIQGHASSDGDDDFNMTLSQKRAQSVVNYLKNQGVENKLTAKGYGETMPVTDESTRAGILANRRVDFVWK
ncbi:MAG: OOP family OmpA-OmpF porin [Rickettsiales bacterium]|jgi:OOP family OmpA-OmpF porin